MLKRDTTCIIWEMRFLYYNYIALDLSMHAQYTGYERIGSGSINAYAWLIHNVCTLHIHIASLFLVTNKLCMMYHINI